MTKTISQTRTLAGLAVSLAAPILVGATAGWATAQGVTDWYPALVKPSFNPPAWVFGPVWTVLYVLMGVACFLVWRGLPASPSARRALAVYGVQLLLNFLWSFLFFGARSPGWAFAEICLLWLALIWTVALFFRESRWAGWLMTPYLGWVSFAAILNAAIWILNRG
jgi:tryptophan-rich sensory protein